MRCCRQLCWRGRRSWVPPCVAIATLVAVSGCVPPRAAGPASGAEVRLADVARQPQEFHDRAVLTRGRLIDASQLPEGTSLRLATSDDGADSVLLLMPLGAAPDLADLSGKELEMLIRVDQSMVLSDGRPAVRVLPMQLGAMTRFAPAAAREVPAEMLAPVAARAGFFRDPQLPAGHSAAPVARFTFLDQDLPRPFWYVLGPVTIEKSGAAAAPEYRFTAVIKSEDGHAKESTCRFRVESGSLRSVAYDEVIRDPSGIQLEEQHLDFISGTVMDKVTGTRGPWPPNIYAGPCLGLALGGYPFMEQHVLNFFLWSDYEPTAAMYAVLDGIEQVTIPAGTFECYRLRMNVDTERMLQRYVFPTGRGADMARAVADKLRQPDTVMWLTKAWPHTVLKVDGAMGPPGTSRSVMERVELDPGTRAAIGGGSGPRSGVP